jgi:hypothetical protein
MSNKEYIILYFVLTIALAGMAICGFNSGVRHGVMIERQRQQQLQRRRWQFWRK